MKKLSGIRVTYSGLISFVTGLLSIVTGLAFMLIVTRTLSIEEFGIWNLINGLLFYGLILDPIITYWTTRETARGIQSAKTSILSTGIFSFGGIFIYLFSILIVGLETDIDYSLFCIAIVLLPVRYLNKVLSGINAGWKPQILSYANFSSEVIKIPTAFLLVYFLEMGVIGVIFSYLIGFSISIIIQIIFAREKIKGEVKTIFLKKWIKLSWVTLYPRLSTIIYRSDIIVFTIITDSVIGIAYYSASLIIANIVGYANAISSSVYGKLLEGGKTKYIQDNIIRLFYFSIPLIAISIVFAKPALFTLNPEYEKAYVVVIFLTGQVFLMTLVNTFSTFLMGIEKVDVKESNFREFVKSKLFLMPTLSLIQFIIYLSTLVVTLILLSPNTPEIVLVKYWASISFISQIPLTIYLFLKIKQNFNLKIEIKIILKYVAGAVLSFGIIFFITDAYLEYNTNLIEFIPSLIILVLFGILGYLGITFVIDSKTRELTYSIINELK